MKKCATCLSKLGPGPLCPHPLYCLHLGWLGRLLSVLIGWGRL